MKRAAMGKDGERPSKAARKRASTDTRCLEAVSVLLRQEIDNEELEGESLVKAQGVKHSAVLPLEWENPDVMAYVRQGAKFPDAKRFELLPNHGRRAKR